jgi:hypothetical protein
VGKRGLRLILVARLAGNDFVMIQGVRDSGVQLMETEKVKGVSFGQDVTGA